MRNKKGLSTVVTTLIILVVAILLANVVVFYAINITTTRVQEENLQIYRQHIWQNGINYSEAAFQIINTGGRDVVVNKISVRGQECAWGTVYYNKTANNISGDLSFIVPTTNGTLLGKSVTVDSGNYSLVRDANNLILKSGWSAIVYVTNPGTISVNDIGTSVGFTVFTANAEYYKEANVGASS